MLYRTTKCEKVKSRIIPLGHCQKIVKTLTNNSSCDRIGRIIYKTPLKAAVNKAVFSEVEKDCAAMCSKKFPSVLRDFSSENVATFSLDKLNIEIQKKAPLLHGVLQHSVKGSILGTVVTAAVALKFRINQLSALHHIVAQILDKGGATDEVGI